MHYNELQRLATISLLHQDTRSYCIQFLASIEEEITLSICVLLKGLEDKTKAALSSLGSSSSSSSSSSINRKSPQEVLSQMRSRGLPYIIHAGFRISSPRKQGKDDEGSKYAWGKEKGRGKGKDKYHKGKFDEDDDYDEPEKVDKPETDTDQFYLILDDPNQRIAPKMCESFNKDDIWLLWKPESAVREAGAVANATLNLGKAADLRANFVKAKQSGYPLPFHGGVVWQDAVLLRANWRYFTSSGWLSCSFLSGITHIPAALGKLPAGKSFGQLDNRFSCLRLTNQEATSLTALDFLRQGLGRPVYSSPTAKMGDFWQCPAFRNLLKGPMRVAAPPQSDRKEKKHVVPDFPQLPAATVLGLANKVSLEFNLNQDQRRVLARVETWFAIEANGGSGHEIVLVHGVFGSGKSFLLAAICVFVSAVSDAWKVTHSNPAAQGNVKIMISSNTNVAVDRILCSLVKKKGASDEIVSGATKCRAPTVARIGNVAKIDADLRKNLVFSQETTKGIKMELEKELRKQKLGEGEREFLEGLATALPKSTFAQSQIRMLREAEVVGVTCASANSLHLHTYSFPILILDEASQMTEPLSFLAIASAAPRFMLVVGDPKQLPPTITQLPGKPVSVPTGVHNGGPSGIARTLFDRLDALEWPSTRLAIQYRCHPNIADLCSKLFYGSTLSSGIRDTDRPALLQGVPPIVNLHCEGTESRQGEGTYNEPEARLILAIVGALRRSSQASAVSIGIICLYKEMALYLSRMLETDEFSSLSGGEGLLRCSTVDAFQGQEMQIIILATTKQSFTPHMVNAERINVAVSRAKNHIFIVGNNKLLKTLSPWREVLAASTQFQVKNGCLSPVSGPPPGGPFRGDVVDIPRTGSTISSIKSTAGADTGARSDAEPPLVDVAGIKRAPQKDENSNTNVPVDVPIQTAKKAKVVAAAALTVSTSTVKPPLAPESMDTCEGEIEESSQTQSQDSRPRNRYHCFG